ncbi:MAG: hypothetical protein ACOH1Y_12740 [Propionicimonas sp.]
MTAPTGVQQVGTTPASAAPPTGNQLASAAPSGTPEFSPPLPSRTPQLLRRLQAAAALALLILGGVGTLLISELRTDLDAAPQLAAQYARLGEVQTQLLEAGALATEGVIEGNGTPTDRAVLAAGRVASASSLLIEAATARPQDAAALAGLNRELTIYASTLRAADGRATKDAQSILDKAGQQLDKELLPDLAALQKSLSTEASASPTPWIFVMPVLGIAAVGFLGWTSWVVAQRSRRVLNFGLVAGIVAVLVISWVTVAAQQGTAAAAAESRGTQFTRVAALTEASSQLGTARRLQTNALLARSWSAAQAKAVTAALDASQKSLDYTAGRSDLAAYRDAEQQLAALMAKADWAAANTLALSSEKTAVTAAATQFHKSVAEASATETKAAATATDEARSGLPWQLAAAVLAALVGAALAAAGIAQRLVDYR